jgi:hypothetical protein
VGRRLLLVVLGAAAAAVVISARRRRIGAADASGNGSSRVEADELRRVVGQAREQIRAENEF